jgi:hypothetical protein
MGLDPVLDMNDPASSVEYVIAIAGDPTRLEAYKQHMVSRWQSYSASAAASWPTLSAGSRLAAHRRIEGAVLLPYYSPKNTGGTCIS